MAKSLKIESPVNGVAEQLIGVSEAQAPVVESGATELPALKRKPRPEAKSRRVSFLIRPSTYKNLGTIAEAEGISINSLVNDFFESSIKRYAKANAS